MAGKPDQAERYRASFLEPRSFQKADRLVAFLVGHLQRIVALIDLEPQRSFELPATLPVESLVEQAVAMLLVPSLADR